MGRLADEPSEAARMAAPDPRSIVSDQRRSTRKRSLIRINGELQQTP